MQINIKEIKGSWDLGYALHKHILSSCFIGYDEYGHERFQNTRSEPGEALFQLKYRNNLSQISPLAEQIKISILPLFKKIDLIIPMPPSTFRTKQPVEELALELGRITGIPVCKNIISKAPTTSKIKNLSSREEKDRALKDQFNIHPCITNENRNDVLLLDDLISTGATMDAACKALRTYSKINRIYAATITW